MLYRSDGTKNRQPVDPGLQGYDSPPQHIKGMHQENETRLGFAIKRSAFGFFDLWPCVLNFELIIGEPCRRQQQAVGGLIHVLVDTLVEALLGLKGYSPCRPTFSMVVLSTLEISWYSTSGLQPWWQACRCSCLCAERVDDKGRFLSCHPSIQPSSKDLY